MNRTTKAFIAILTPILLCIAPAFAKVKQVPMYMFGYAASFKDSTAYITSIQRLDTVTIDQKTKFLKDRNLYSYQLQQYITNTYGQEDVFTAVFYDTKPAKLEKKVATVMGKSDKDNSLRLKALDFRFHCEEWIEPEVLETNEDTVATHTQKDAPKKHKAKKSK